MSTWAVVVFFILMWFRADISLILRALASRWKK